MFHVQTNFEYENIHLLMMYKIHSFVMHYTSLPRAAKRLVWIRKSIISCYHLSYTRRNVFDELIYIYIYTYFCRIQTVKYSTRKRYDDWILQTRVLAVRVQRHIMFQWFSARFIDCTTAGSSRSGLTYVTARNTFAIFETRTPHTGFECGTCRFDEYPISRSIRLNAIILTRC